MLVKNNEKFTKTNQTTHIMNQKRRNQPQQSITHVKNVTWYFNDIMN